MSATRPGISEGCAASFRVRHDMIHREIGTSQFLAAVKAALSLLKDKIALVGGVQPTLVFEDKHRFENGVKRVVTDCSFPISIGV